jgi:DNA polymerase-3 subunit gamma/tau
MAYTVLARKHRSRTFDEIAGQDAIATTLRNAIESGRVHHGYLFTGTRGVGKTSMARILAKSLNCLTSDGPTAKPCLECESCRLIAEGEDIDVVEIDAASNTGVDNIRDLRSNTVYRPARSRFKIYIIDEVHMLSAGAFNALLKTLEEPPPHVKFVLATTEIQKVPATIQSRCQRFDFHSIDSDTIAEQLRRILADEGIEAEESVIRRVARLANGSMRDALSLLDQLLAFGSQTLDEELIEQILPTPHNELIFELVEQLGGGDAAAALICTDKCFASGQTPERFCETLIEHLRTLMILAVCGPTTDLIDAPSQIREQLAAQCQRFDAATYVYMITLAQELRRSVKFSGAGRALIDAAVVRLALSEQFTDLKTVLASLGSGAAAPARQKAAPRRAAQPAASDARPATPAPRRTSSTRPRRASSAAPSAGQATAPQGNLSADSKRKVMADPAIQRAVRLFDGTVVDIKPRREPSHAGNQPDESPVNDEAELTG